MRKYSTKPCPGCGAELALAPNSVCGSCKEAISQYPRTKAAVANTDTSNMLERLLGERSGIPNAIYKYDAAPAFAMALSALLRSVGHATANTDPKGFYNPSPVKYSSFGVMECKHRDIAQQDWRIHLPNDAEDRLHDLFQAIRAVVSEAEEKGRSEGQNLLFQLNSGALSIDDFNKAATGHQR